MYSLEKHKNGKHKHICPRCDKRTFVRYINNETACYLHDTVGRCDRQDNCGYHYPPKEYHKNNPNNNYTYDNPYLPTRTLAPCTNSTKGANQSTPINYIPFRYIEQSAKTRNNNLIYYLLDLFDWETICRSIDPYFIGCTKDKAVIFPQIDANGKVRTGKIMQYNPETGRRIKDNINWIHTKLIRKGLLPNDFEAKTCLFGEHLVRSDKNKGKVVCIVESEKTALIAAICMPQFVWMSRGGLENLNVGKLEPIKDRAIVLHPDTSAKGSAFAKWKRIADEARCLGYKVSVSVLLEKSATDVQKANGYDLGDYLIDRLSETEQPKESSIEKPPEPLMQSAVLDDMMGVNPVLAKLVDRFDAVVV